MENRSVHVVLLSLLICTTTFAAPGVVVIDAGHGGHDRGGAPYQRIPEKGYTLDTARRLARNLRRLGVRVVMTRDDDSFVSLSQRTYISNLYSPRDAVFVSIHYNSGWREGAYGIETYYHNRRAYRLAALVHPRVINAMNSADRGIRWRGYWVLRRNRLPAILVECGFLTNRAEAARIEDPDYRERTARAIAGAIMRY
jgi:N-acetylmuramoyl-L-alanine amidase